MNRIYTKQNLIIDKKIEIDGKTYHYLFKVLRKKETDKLMLFNGDGFDYQAVIKEVNKKNALIKIIKKIENNTESNIYTVLVQCISKLDKMDLVIQKAVELGVNEIIPVYSEFSNVRLNEKRQQKKIEHWQSIIISACEQSRRAIIPKLHNISKLENLAEQLDDINIYKKICLDPYSKQTFSNIKINNEKVLFLVGPEGGVSDKDDEILQGLNFEKVRFGKRILRLETAAISSLAVIQLLWGDLNV